ncbi:hypothetical protein [Planktothrix pseudagardhii]|uniref:Uncharacterized protein n=1 Tax=Planktothrix pseudagardhii TaxID=132604 RepID=A0A9W4G8Y2_9CYAN|nr:hypothetical protein [Planktothrix pseudagardhii]CAD5964287.1 hypothetical protein NO713_03399 [Planktothrix pseudagardhii]
MSNKDNIADQITCNSIKLHGPLQGKKIEVKVDVKSVKEEQKPKPEKNSDWETLGFLFLLLFFLVAMVGNSVGLGSSSSPVSQPSSALDRVQYARF